MDTNPVQRLQAENERLATELAALSRELEAARECHVEKLERAVRAEAEAARLNRWLVQIHDVLAERGDTEPELWAIRTWLERAMQGEAAG